MSRFLILAISFVLLHATLEVVLQLVLVFKISRLSKSCIVYARQSKLDLCQLDLVPH